MSFEFDEPGLYWLIVAGIFVASFLIQIFYYLFFFLRFVLYKANSAVKNSGEPVSVVICAKDEAANLENNLPNILEQDYPDYEVVVVNDCSEDNTEEVLERLKKKYKNLRSTRIKKDPKFRHNKKLALTIGIKCAVHEWLLLTDADCSPASPLWISQMQKHFIAPNEIVIGYSGYERKKGFLNRLVRFDLFFSALQFLSYSICGCPYKAVGKNMAYKRSLFFNNRGFASHLSLEYGEDDLFINSVSTKENCRVEFSHLAHTCSDGPTTLYEWFRQKRRSLSTAAHYKPSTRLLLGTELVSRFLYYCSFIMLIPGGVLLKYAAALFIIRMLVNALIMNSAMNRLNEKGLILLSPFFDLFVFLFNTICFISNRIYQRNKGWR